MIAAAPAVAIGAGGARGAGARSGASACDSGGATWRSKLAALKSEPPLGDLPSVDEAPPDSVTLKAEAFAAQARTEDECLDAIGTQRTEVKTWSYDTLRCNVTEDHVAMQCVTVPGVGHDFRWQATVGDQVGPESDVYVSYTAPYVARIDLPGDVGRRV